MTVKSQSSAHLQVESLENRELPASQLLASLSGGVLRVEGTNDADHVVVRKTADRIAVNEVMIQTSGWVKRSHVSASEINAVEIRTLGGNDRIELLESNGRAANLNVPVSIWSGSGDDQVWGSLGNDFIHGDGGNDALRGLAGNDRIFGGGGDDQIHGGNGSDEIHGGTGTNYLVGNDGADVFFSESDRDRIDGSSGVDTAHLSYFAPDPDASYQRIYDVERIIAPKKTNVADPIAEPVPETPLEQELRVQEESNPFSGTFAETEQRVWSLLNQHREDNGLAPLSVNEQLMQAARYQADYLARTEHYSHVNLDGAKLVDRVNATGYRYSWIAENIHKYDVNVRRTVGVNHTYALSELAEYFFDGWRASDAHNFAMLSSRAEMVGIALARASSGNVYAVQVFGDPR